MFNDLNQLCRCCAARTDKVFEGELIGHVVSYFECAQCGYLQTETPYWLEQAYSSAINNSDTGIMIRNQANARITLATLYLTDKLKGTVVDYAGGYGILVRLLRDFGVNALWSDQYCDNLLARGFEYNKQSADLVTAFEVFEHFINPADELDRLLAIAPNVLLSTAIIPDDTPKQDEWWYYGKEHGQHIGFFKVKTLEYLAKRRGKYLVSNGHSYHFICDKPIGRNVWLLMLRLNRLHPMLLRRKLTSKVWLDHEFIVKNEISPRGERVT